MTVLSDLEQVIAYCEATKGSYALLAHSTDEKQAKDRFNAMKADLENHLEFLTGRVEYLKQNNDLYKNKQ